jgi:proline iminopeptidase
MSTDQIKEPCLVIAFYDHTIRLLSDDLKTHFTFFPADIDGWNTPFDQLHLDSITIASLLMKIDDARRAAGSDRINILGFSFGGMIALDYAIAFPDNVSRVITICSPPCWTSAYHKYREDFQKHDLSEERASILQANQVRFEHNLSLIPIGERFYRYTVVQAPLYWYNPTFDESIYWEGLTVNLSLINHVDSILYKEHDQSTRFPEIEIPVFAAFGRYDYATPHCSWEPYDDIAPIPWTRS